MGDLKREIVMLGDTMNTAARIELGAIALRGKEGDVRLSALTRA